MATTSSRRSVRSKSARPKAAKPGKAAKRAAPKKAGAGQPAKRGPAPPKSRLVAKPAKAAKPLKAMPTKAAKAPPVKAGKTVPPKGGKPAKGAPPVVRPLGVLPPESRARIHEKAAAAPPRPRPSVPAPPSRMTPQGAQRVTEKDLKFFEERLLAERQKLLKDMGHLETTVLKVNQRDSSGDLSGYSFHMADAGTDAMEREKAFMFASAEGRILMEIDDALRRLYKGEYGMCEICGNPIARARLEAMPYARLCVSCKEKEERQSRGAAQNQNQGPGTGTGAQ